MNTLRSLVVSSIRSTTKARGFLCCHKSTNAHPPPPTHPWRCRLLLVVHFFHTSMFFLMVPSPLHNTEQTAAPVRHIPSLARGVATTRDPPPPSHPLLTGQKLSARQKLSKRWALADCSHHCCLPACLTRSSLWLFLPSLSLCCAWQGHLASALQLAKLRQHLQTNAVLFWP